jgi:DNA-binding NarL/FixJ family response regulator
MPQVNGLEATQQIKAERSETKVIIMTVHTEDAYRQAAQASGADAFLLKKTLMTALLPTIRCLCSGMSLPNSP